MKYLRLFLLLLLLSQSVYANSQFENLIAANDTNILASQDVNNSSNSSDHQHLNVSYGTSVSRPTVRKGDNG